MKLPVVDVNGHNLGLAGCDRRVSALVGENLAGGTGKTLAIDRHADERPVMLIMHNKSDGSGCGIVGE